MVHSLEHAHIWGITALTIAFLSLVKFGFGTDGVDPSAIFAVLGSLAGGIITITIEALKHIGKDKDVRS